MPNNAFNFLRKQQVRILGYSDRMLSTGPAGWRGAAHGPVISPVFRTRSFRLVEAALRNGVLDNENVGWRMLFYEFAEQ